MSSYDIKTKIQGYYYTVSVGHVKESHCLEEIVCFS